MGRVHVNNLKPQTLRRLLNFEAHHDLNLELEKFLNNGGRVKVAVPSPKNFPTWMTVTRALHPTAEAYIEALEANGSAIEDGARKIVKAMNVSQQKTVVELKGTPYTRHSFCEMGS